MTKEIERCIRIMFPNDPEDRTRHILKRLRNDKDKDHHCAGSLTYLGRCALDHAAADLIESLSKQCDDQNEMLHWAYGILKKLDKGLEEHGFDSFEEVYAQLEQVTKERDAAIRDIDEAAPCFACIRFERNGGDCIGAHVCVDDILQDALGGKYADYYWQWRGVEVTDDAQKGSDAKS